MFASTFLIFNSGIISLIILLLNRLRSGLINSISLKALRQVIIKINDNMFIYINYRDCQSSSSEKRL
jgi:hypothetical protein